MCKQQVHALSGGSLSLSVLGSDPLFSASQAGFFYKLVEVKFIAHNLFISVLITILENPMSG